MNNINNNPQPPPLPEAFPPLQCNDCNSLIARSPPPSQSCTTCQNCLNRILFFVYISYPDHTRPGHLIQGKMACPVCFQLFSVAQSCIQCIVGCVVPAGRPVDAVKCIHCFRSFRSHNSFGSHNCQVRPDGAKPQHSCIFPTCERKKGDHNPVPYFEQPKRVHIKKGPNPRPSVAGIRIIDIGSQLDLTIQRDVIPLIQTNLQHLLFVAVFTSASNLPHSFSAVSHQIIKGDWNCHLTNKLNDPATYIRVVHQNGAAGDIIILTGNVGTKPSNRIQLDFKFTVMVPPEESKLNSEMQAGVDILLQNIHEGVTNFKQPYESQPAESFLSILQNNSSSSSFNFQTRAPLYISSSSSNSSDSIQGLSGKIVGLEILDVDPTIYGPVLSKEQDSSVNNEIHIRGDISNTLLILNTSKPVIIHGNVTQHSVILGSWDVITVNGTVSEQSVIAGYGSGIDELVVESGAVAAHAVIEDYDVLMNVLEIIKIADAVRVHNEAKLVSASPSPSQIIDQPAGPSTTTTATAVPASGGDLGQSLMKSIRYSKNYILEVQQSISTGSSKIFYAVESCKILISTAIPVIRCVEALDRNKERGPNLVTLAKIDLGLKRVVAFLKSSSRQDSMIWYLTDGLAKFQLTSIQESLGTLAKNLVFENVPPAELAKVQVESDETITNAVKADTSSARSAIPRSDESYFFTMSTMTNATTLVNTSETDVGGGSSPRAPSTVASLIEEYWKPEQFIHIPQILAPYASIPTKEDVKLHDTKFNGVSKSDIALAQLYLGHYHRLQGPEPNHKVAFQWYLHSYIFGDKEAGVHLVHYYLTGIVEKIKDKKTGKVIKELVYLTKNEDEAKVIVESSFEESDMKLNLARLGEGKMSLSEGSDIAAYLKQRSVA